jgi:branched-chain amino acid transport system substrate-binding protein
MSKNKIIRLQVSFLLIVALLIYWNFYNKKEDIKIGFVAGLSGKYSELGTEERNGFLLAVDQINAKGGINSQKISFEIKDDGQDPQKAKEAFNHFINNNYKIIVGPATSSMATEVIDIINAKSDLTVISPTVSSSSFSNRDDNLIRFGNPNSKGKIELLANHVIANKPNAKNALMIYDTTNSSYAKKWNKDFTNSMNNISIKTISLAVDASKSYLIDIEKFINSHESFDVIAMALNGKSAAETMQKLRLLNVDALFYAGGWALSEDLFLSGGHSVEGLNILTPFNPISQKAKYLEFKEAYHKRYGKEPGSFATRSYEVVNFIAKALDKNPNIEDFKSTFLSIETFNGLQKDVKINHYGDPIGYSDSILTIKDGKFVKTDN